MNKNFLIVSVMLSFALLTGCSKEPSEIKLPSNIEEIKEVNKYVQDNLEGEDKEIAEEVLAKIALGNALGFPTDTNMTLADAIDSVKADRAKKAAQEEKNKSIIDRMNKAIEVVYINHKAFEKLGRKGYDFRIKLRNKQDKPIFGVKGDLVFIDAFGKESGRVNIEHVGTLNKNDNVYIQYKTMPNIGMDEYFKDMDYKSSNVKFEPHVIVYNDKSSISIAELE